jgi:hypothetical protein
MKMINQTSTITLPGDGTKWGYRVLQVQVLVLIGAALGGPDNMRWALGRAQALSHWALDAGHWALEALGTGH